MLLQKLSRVFVDVQNDLGTPVFFCPLSSAYTPESHRKSSGPPLLLPVGLGQNLDLARHHEGRIEPEAKVPDDPGVVLFVFEFLKKTPRPLKRRCR